VLVFTAEEAWRARPWAEGEASVHLRIHPETPAAWRDDALAAKWDKVREIRRVVTGALELARADKKIGASLQAHPVVHLTPERRAMLDGVDLSEISITSGITVSDAPAANGAFTLPDVPGVAVLVNPAAGGKCDRCWQVLPEVGSHAHHPTLCNRCSDVVEGAAGGA
jgi:isoleucyl-tRNA synthetase